jgi:hypothetical protein
VRVLLLRHTQDGVRADAAVDMPFGALWYRLLIGHAALGPVFARDLARLITHGHDS